MPKVKCSVDSCEYWGRSGTCNADTISVNKASSARTEFADEPGSIPAKEQPTGKARPTLDDDFRGTCCGTMRRRRREAVDEQSREPRKGHCRP